MMIDWSFVETHANKEPASLRLKFLGRGTISDSERITIAASIDQIECRRKYAGKFPCLIDRYPRFSFPSVLACEQASHLWVATLHGDIAASLVSSPGVSKSDCPCSIHRLRLLDMTAGLGLDFLSMAEKISSDGNGCVAVEVDPQKAEALRQNLYEAGLSQAHVITGDSLEILSSKPQHSIDIIFADPARRGEGNSRIFNPSACMPDVTGHWNELLEKGEWVMVKNSPMLDIHRVLEIFPGTVRVYVTSVRNECKEVLVIARDKGEFEGIECVNILGEQILSDIQKNTECRNRLRIQRSFIPAKSSGENAADMAIAEPEDVKPGVWLYEPNSSWMKVRAWNTLGADFKDLKKLSKNSHLFISKEKHEDFPGRILCISSVPEGKAERKLMKGGNWNVVTRNYPMKPEALCRNLGISSGGKDFLYGLTVGASEKPMILTAKEI